MGTRIIIQHASGSKANQIEQFQLDDTEELTFGRDPACTVAYDPQRDDAVSRRHATIAVQKGERPVFRLSDLGSSNGTRVNGERITGACELMPGDSVELGAGGPRFTFDLQPRPPHLVARTRVIDTAAAAPAPTAATRVTGTDIAAPVPTKVGVGRETVQRLLTEERKATGRVWMYSLAGVLAVLGLVGGGLYYKMRSASEETAAALNSTQAALNNTQAALSNTQAALSSAQNSLTETITSRTAEVAQKFGLSPEEIVHKWGNSTVYIEFRWRLFDRGTGRPLYHKRILVDGELVPCYVRLPSGEVVRWLTNEDDNHRNQLIGGGGSGTGFVINEQGFILSNKHVVAGWSVPWRETAQQLYEGDHRLLFEAGDKRLRPITETRADAWKDVISWLPEQGGLVFGSELPVPLARSSSPEGQNEKLAIRFPGNRISVEGRLIRVSTEADVAVAKIDAQQTLASVELAADNVVKVGERVTVLGYPDFSVKTVALTTTIEAGEVHQRQDIIPEPTVTDGLISRLSPASQRQGAATTVGEMGDVYQLSVATGAGNSGGPVFNAAGKVIGLFTYGRSDRETTTFAVPIRYGRDLLQVQRAN